MLQITVLLAVYNGSHYIDQQLESMLSQTYTDCKIIVLDDYSTDNTYQLLKAWAVKYPKIRIYRNKSNLGVVRTFEKLLESVDTPYFALADQDDYWLKDKVLRSVELLDKEKVDLVYTDLFVVDEDLNMIHESKWRFSNTPPVSGRNPIPIIIKNPVTGCTIVGRTSLLKKALPFPKGVPMHDRWLSVVACTENGIAALDQPPTMLYRQHTGNEVGGLPYGFNGLFRRVRKDAKGNFLNYLKIRVQKRLCLLDVLEKIGYMTDDTVFLREYYRSSWLQRMIGVTRYARVVNRNAACLGKSNLLTDITLNLLPY